MDWSDFDCDWYDDDLIWSYARLKATSGYGQAKMVLR